VIFPRVPASLPVMAKSPPSLSSGDDKFRGLSLGTPTPAPPPVMATLLPLKFLPGTPAPLPVMAKFLPHHNMTPATTSKAYRICSNSSTNRGKKRKSQHHTSCPSQNRSKRLGSYWTAEQTHAVSARQNSCLKCTTANSGQSWELQVQ
jgi:hypothetical protein